MASRAALRFESGCALNVPQASVDHGHPRTTTVSACAL
jgi:hypothetical protein